LSVIKAGLKALYTFEYAVGVRRPRFRFGAENPDVDGLPVQNSGVAEVGSWIRKRIFEVWERWRRSEME
jgi:hypothetical protein